MARIVQLNFIIFHVFSCNHHHHYHLRNYDHHNLQSCYNFITHFVYRILRFFLLFFKKWNILLLFLLKIILFSRYWTTSVFFTSVIFFSSFMNLLLANVIYIIGYILFIRFIKFFRDPKRKSAQVCDPI